MSSDLVTANEISSTAQYVASQDGVNSTLSLSTDNVGIGTDSPGVPLDLQSQGSNTVVFRVNGSAGNSIASISEGGASGAGNLSLNTSEGTTAIKFVAGTKGYSSWINTGANFGIGTDSPSSTLEVDGSLTASGQVTLKGVQPTSEAPSSANLEAVFVDTNTGILYYQ